MYEREGYFQLRPLPSTWQVGIPTPVDLTFKQSNLNQMAVSIGNNYEEVQSNVNSIGTLQTLAGPGAKH